MPSIREMLELDREALDELFAEAESPDVDDLQGHLSGLHYSGAGFLDNRLFKRAFNSSPWRGMSVEGSRGVNHLGYPPVTFDAVEFTVSRTALEEGEAVLFDYGDLNLPPLSGIREHVRRVDDDTYLCAAKYCVAGDLRFMYYFGVEPTREIEVK